MGRTTTKDIFDPSHGVPDSFDAGQIEDGFFNSKSIKGYRNSYSLTDTEHHESNYNLLTQWDHGEKLLQPPLCRKESTSELTAKTKGSDRIFTIKLGLSSSLMVQEGIHNHYVTLKGYPRNSGVCLVRKLTKHNRSHNFTTKGGLSLTLMSNGQPYNPKCKHKCLPNETLGFRWDGQMYSTHNTAKFPD